MTNSWPSSLSRTCRKSGAGIWSRSITAQVIARTLRSSRLLTQSTGLHMGPFLFTQCLGSGVQGLQGVSRTRSNHNTSCPHSRSTGWAAVLNRLSYAVIRKDPRLKPSRGYSQDLTVRSRRFLIIVWYLSCMQKIEVGFFEVGFLGWQIILRRQPATLSNLSNLLLESKSL